MNELEARIEKAQADSGELEALLTDYLPFLKKHLADTPAFALEYDDRLSLAMLTFVGCVRQYTPGRGGFLAFCTTCIRNRFIDEARRQGGYASRVVPLFPGEEGTVAPDAAASLAAYDRAQEAQALQEEIDSLSAALAVYGVVFGELPRICPKQARSRQQCLALARAIVRSTEYRTALLTQRRIMQGELAKLFGISPKTIEKHRKYIVMLAILLLGEYPGIRAFLPQFTEVR